MRQNSLDDNWKPCRFAQLTHRYPRRRGLRPRRIYRGALRISCVREAALRIAFREPGFAPSPLEMVPYVAIAMRHISNVGREANSRAALIFETPGERAH